MAPSRSGPKSAPGRTFPFPTAPLSKGAVVAALHTGKPDPADLTGDGIDPRRAELFVGANQAMHGFHKRGTVPRTRSAYAQEARPVGTRSAPVILY